MQSARVRGRDWHRACSPSKSSSAEDVARTGALMQRISLLALIALFALFAAQARAEDKPAPCTGWENDPQSWAVKLADAYYSADHPNPKTRNPSVRTVTLAKLNSFLEGGTERLVT